MPKFNGTGPMGQGSKTGRCLGSCGNVMRSNRVCCGYGFRRFISPKNEIAALENEEKILEEELTAIKEEKEALKNKQK
jgi:hypothetical protein